MAKQVHVSLVDDITDEEIDAGGETIAFAVNGAHYEIDLSDKNAVEFHRKLDYYIKYGRRVGGRKTPAGNPQTAGAGSERREQVRAIRSWAHAHGYAVSDRGRIPGEVEAAFHAAHE